MAFSWALVRASSESLYSQASLSKDSETSNGHKQAFAGAPQKSSLEKTKKSQAKHRCWSSALVTFLVFGSGFIKMGLHHGYFPKHV